MAGHDVRAAWGRFRGVADLDQLGDADWRGRFRHTSRAMSTAHFCYPGTWIWLIPLRGGVSSLGVVSLRERWRPSWSGRAGLEAGLKAHPGLAPLLTDAEALDFGACGQVSHSARRFFDPAARWALTGEAAGFTDPLYSPGCDFIAYSNDMTCELIRRDVAGLPSAELAEQLDAYLRHRLRISMAVYRGQYPGLGSYDLFRLRYFYDLYNYFNQISAYALDAHLEPSYLREALRRGPAAMAALEGIGRDFAAMATTLTERGRYYAGNLGGADGYFDRSFQASLTRDRTVSDVFKLQRRLHHAASRRLRAWSAAPDEAPPTTGWMQALWGEVGGY